MKARRSNESLDFSVIQVARAAADHALESELALLSPEEREQHARIIMDAVIAGILVHRELHGQREFLGFSRN